MKLFLLKKNKLRYNRFYFAIINGLTLLIVCLLLFFNSNNALAKAPQSEQFYYANNKAISSNLANAIDNIKNQINKLNKSYMTKKQETTKEVNKTAKQDLSTYTHYYYGHLFISKTKLNLNHSKHFLQNINLLYKMGYLPFKTIYFDRQANTVTWQWDASSVPKQLIALTPNGNNSIIYKGAIMAFLHQTNIGIDSYNLHELLKEVYHHGLFKAEKTFVWVLVSQTQPQTLKAWQAGQWILETNVNTGVDNTTPDGNFIIYSRHKYYPMKGIFPITNKPYFDKKVPYVNFFNGAEAIHGFHRYAYGYPQSAGCVELPINNAKRLYKILYVGAIVTIIN